MDDIEHIITIFSIAKSRINSQPNKHPSTEISLNISDIQKTINALRFTQKALSGEISDGMYDAHCKMLESSGPNWIKIQFEAMVKQLAEDIKNEQQG